MSEVELLKDRFKHALGVGRNTVVSEASDETCAFFRRRHVPAIDFAQFTRLAHRPIPLTAPSSLPGQGQFS